MKIMVVVPAFNEASRIGDLLTDLIKTKHKTIVVDDGSSDATADVVRKFTLNSKILLIRHKVNLGKGAAMKTGTEVAFKLGADGIVYMDSDGQHVVKDLSNFIKALEDGFPIVYGSRNLAHGVPLLRYLGNKTVSLLISFLYGVYISDILCGFRAISRQAYKKMKWESRGYAVESEMVVKAAKAGLKHCEVPVSTIYYDKFKGVTVVDAMHIFFDLVRWRLKP